MRAITQDEIDVINKRVYFICIECSNEDFKASEAEISFREIDIKIAEENLSEAEGKELTWGKGYGAVIIEIPGEEINFYYKGKCPKCGSSDILAKDY